MQIALDIRTGGLDSPQVVALLQQHLQSMTVHSPPESIHALDLDGLRKPEITFWSAWQDDDLLGIGALKELDPRHGEIKSMRTADQHLRKGVGARLLEHIIQTAQERSYERLSLETGSMDAFAAARALYVRFCFRECAPFASYAEDRHSTFMTKTLR